ncbi:hypothetical protein DB313_05445 (plasmid) [Borrelia turcica IST7]|uniref:Uncharacterized protein n=1 Tax=Borrelia turcica IST7 TaxID=1104446 RepID=A0A386PN54_9SPIR|nr:DUF693 family protein [Borrelia turcica]AYE36944.1 hypothetical protein DB313_05445 [Borrelia turcica IST7]
METGNKNGDLLLITPYILFLKVTFTIENLQKNKDNKEEIIYLNLQGKTVSEAIKEVFGNKAILNMENIDKNKEIQET